MKDFAVRIWDSKNKEMVIVTDLTLNTFYKLHTGENQEEPMIASPYYDANGVRLFEKDVCIPCIKPKSSEYISWGDIKKFPTKREDFSEELEDDYELPYYMVLLEDSWYLHEETGVRFSSYQKIDDALLRRDNWRGYYKNHPEAIKYVKIGTIYSCSKAIEDAKKVHLEKEDAEKREKELSCLMKLKEKYEGVTV